MNFIVKRGIMPKPQNCNDCLYTLMKRCWSFEPSKRQSFKEIVKFLLVKVKPDDDAILRQFREKSFFTKKNPEVRNNPLYFKQSP
jgi:hypothetical protein